jgi:hypothetical protein
MEGVWVLREMRLAGADAFVPGDSSRFTVEFAPDGGMGVVADCNQCGGTYTLDGEALVVPDLVCTLVLCPTPEGQQFATLLEGTSFGRGGGRPARDRVRRGQADAVPLNAGRRRLRRHAGAMARGLLRLEQLLVPRPGLPCGTCTVAVTARSG